MLRIKIDDADPKVAKICLFSDAILVDYEVIPYSEDFEYQCLLTAAALREKFELVNKPLWKRVQDALPEIEAKCNATESAKRGAS